MAERFTDIDGTSGEKEFLEALQGEVTSPYALGFVKGNAESLLQAQSDLLEAEAKIAATSDAIDKFVEEHVTTASAVKVTLKPRPSASNKLDELVFDFDPNEMVDGKYIVEFELFRDTGYAVVFDTGIGACYL